MKIEKEVLVAIIVGVIIGSLTAFFLVFLPKYFPKTGGKDQGEPFKEEATLSPTATYPLTIESPKEEEVSADEKITVSGKATPGFTIAVISALDEQVAEANDEGHFEAEIALEEGTNEISITAYSKEGQEETVKVTVFYTEEEI